MWIKFILIFNDVFNWKPFLYKCCIWLWYNYYKPWLMNLTKFPVDLDFKNVDVIKVCKENKQNQNWLSSSNYLYSIYSFCALCKSSVSHFHWPACKYSNAIQMVLNFGGNFFNQSENSIFIVYKRPAYPFSILPKIPWNLKIKFIRNWTIK